MRSIRFIKRVWLLAAPLFFTLTASAQVDPVSDPKINVLIQPYLKMLNTSGGKPIHEMAPKDSRSVFTYITTTVKNDLSGVDISEKIIQEDGLTIKLNIVRPKGVQGQLPAFLFFHGGVWVLGDFPTHERLVRDLVVGSGAVGIFVNYTPAPDARYPVQKNEAYAATKWVSEHGQDINVDGSRIALAGNSVGGTLSTVVSLMSKERSGPKIRLQLLLCPVTDDNFETASYNEFANGRYLSKSLMIYGWDKYTTNNSQRSEIYVSPLKASIEQLSGLPPAFVATAEEDVLRDEGEAYARKLNAAGVNVTSVRYNGMIHDFFIISALKKVPETDLLVQQASDQLRKFLGK